MNNTPRPTKHGEVPQGNTHPNSRVQCPRPYSAYPTAARKQETRASKCEVTSPCCQPPHVILPDKALMRLCRWLPVRTLIGNFCHAKDWDLK